jgi:hypothetical protein
LRRRALAGAVAALCCAAAAPALAEQAKKDGSAVPRADFHAVCPFTVASPSVFAVLDAKRWQNVLAAARTVPPPYEAGGTDFKRESIVVVVLPYTSTPITQAALNAKSPERFDAKTGTLSLYYDVKMEPVKPGEVATTVIGEPCLITWVARRSDVLQIIARTTDGRYIAGTRLGEKPKKKAPAPVPLPKE